MRFRSIAVFIPVLIAFVNGFDLKCNVATGSIDNVGTITYCNAKLLTITSQNETITSVNGVTTPTTFYGIDFLNLKVHYLPKGLGAFFPNLKELEVHSSGLKTVEAADLENLTALESLYIDRNDIEELSSDLFKFTPNITYVSLPNNQIARVGKDLLTNLTSLLNFNFDFNKCMNSESPTDLETMKNTLRAQCPEPEDQLKEKYCSEDFKRYEKEIEDLKAEIEKTQITDLKVEISTN